MPDIIIEFTDLSLPTEEPFDKKRPEKQRENLAYVCLQIIRKLKQYQFTLTVPEESVVIGDIGTLLTEIRDNIADLKFNGESVTYSTKDAKITIDFLGKTITQ